MDKYIYFDNTIYNIIFKITNNKEQAEIMARRFKANEVDEAVKFIKPKREDICDISKLTDIEKGVDIIIKHTSQSNRIGVITDYDCDGVSSATIIMKSFSRYLKTPLNNISLIINKRAYGNGVNDTMVKEILRQHKEKPIGLIITADHGSADDVRYKILKENGIEILVTDHHELSRSGLLKNVDAFINPQRPDSTYTKNVSGATVAFLLMREVYVKMFNKNRSDILPIDKLKAFVALTVLSDVMSIKDITNRVFLMEGLAEINKFDDPMWKVFLNSLSGRKRIEGKDLSFGLIPKINSGQRMGDPYPSYNFLISDNHMNAYRNFEEIVYVDKKRKSRVADLNRLVDNMKEEVYVFDKVVVLLLNNSGGVNGIIANNLVGKYNKLSIVFNNSNGDIIAGSCRSIPSVSVVNTFNKVIDIGKDIVVSGGGHHGAGGIKIKKDKLPEFIKLLNTVIGTTEAPTIMYDKEIKLEEVTPTLYESVVSLEPYGKDFKEPLYKSKVKIQGVKVIGKDRNFVKLMLVDGEKRVSAFATLNVMNEVIKNKSKGKYYYVYYVLNVNNFMGNSVLQTSIANIVEI